MDAAPIAQRRDLTEIALFAGVGLLYFFTFASIPTADGAWYIGSIDKPDFKSILDATSAGTQVSMYLLTRLLAGLGVHVPTLTLIQSVNAIAAATGAVIFYRVLRLLGDRLTGALGAALLATSFGYWYFANGERQHLSLVVLLLIFWALVRARVKGIELDWKLVAAMGLLNAVAVALRQENFLFGLAAIALLGSGRPWRSALREGGTYFAAGAVGTFVLAAMLALCAVSFGTKTFSNYVSYYFTWLADYTKNPQDYQGFAHATSFDIPRAVKGQLTALVVGTQAVMDAARGLVAFTHRKVASLVAMTALIGLLMIMSLVDLWLARGRIRGPYRAVAIGCVAWLVPYAILHALFWPTVTKYQVVTLPPLILLLVLSALATHASAGRAVGSIPASTWRVLVLLVLVCAVNVWGGIRPWYQYGQWKERLAAAASREFRPSDFFISSESGIDAVLHRDDNYLTVKDEFLEAAADTAFSTIWITVRDRLDRNQRVFVYNFVPSAFTMVGINQAPMRGPRPLSPRDFESFFERLRATYATRQVFSYWEESKAPLYLFGESLEPFWELAARPPA